MTPKSENRLLTAILLAFILIILLIFSACTALQESPQVIVHGEWKYVFYRDKFAITDAYRRMYPNNRLYKYELIGGFADCNNKTIHSIRDFRALTVETTHCLDKDFVDSLGASFNNMGIWRKEKVR